MGKTGKMWGYENLGIEPDACTSAKAIGGGVPLGAMLCKEKFIVFGPGSVHEITIEFLFFLLNKC